MDIAIETDNGEESFSGYGIYVAEGSQSDDGMWSVTLLTDSNPLIEFINELADRKNVKFIITSPTDDEFIGNLTLSGDIQKDDDDLSKLSFTLSRKLL